MDFVLLALGAIYFAKGCWKGCVSMLFSFVGTVFVSVVAWKTCPLVAQAISPLLLQPIQSWLKGIFSGAFPGIFSDMAALENAILSGGAGGFAGFFGAFLPKLLGDITFEGSLSTGEILAPSVSQILLKVVAFALIFVGLFLALKIAKFFINRLVRSLGLGWGNRLLGGVLGLLKGLLLFGVIYLLLCTPSNIILNPGLANFVQSGVVSNFLYKNLAAKIIAIFY